MTVWSKLAEENGTPVSVHGNVRFGIPGNWTTPVAVNGPITTTAASYGRTTNPALLGQVQTDAADAVNRFVKIMIIGDQIAQLSGSTGWRTQLYSQFAAQSGFHPTDFVGNATYTANDGTSDPDHNGYANYIATDLNKTSGTGTPGTGFLGDVRDVAAWFNEQAPDIVILHLGTNDCAAGAITTANITAAYALLLAAARAAKSEVIFYVCKLIKHTDGTINGRISSLNTAIAAWAPTVWTAASPVEVIDMNTSFNSGTMLQGAGLLPNSTGATFMATQAFNALDPWLLKPPVPTVAAGQPFDRVSLSIGGHWPAYPIPLDTSTDGTVVTWFTPGDDGVTDPMTGRTYKSGQDLVSVALVGGMTGVTQNNSSGVTFTGGNTANSTAGNHISTVQTIGHGYTITIAAPKWPTWYRARIWFYTALPTQLLCVASMDDSEAVTQTINLGDPTGVIPPAQPWWDDYGSLQDIYYDVRFSSDKPSKTLTVTITRVGASMGYCIFNCIQIINDEPGTLLQSPPGLAMAYLGGVG